MEIQPSLHDQTAPKMGSYETPSHLEVWIRSLSILFPKNNSDVCEVQDSNNKATLYVELQEFRFNQVAQLLNLDKHTVNNLEVLCRQKLRTTSRAITFINNLKV